MEVAHHYAHGINLADQAGRNRAIEERYDELIAEQDQLLRDLRKYPCNLFPLLDATIFSDETIKRIAGDWLNRVRQETQFLVPFDALGVTVVSEDLTRQPGFPEIRVIFDSEEMREDRMRRLKHAGGEVDQYSKEVRLPNAHPSLREQLYSLLLEGKLHPAAATLWHELIHKKQHQEAPKKYDDYSRDRIPMEVQAHMGSFNTDGYQSSLVDIGTCLTDRTPDALYKFDLKPTLCFIELISALYALGKTDSEIAIRVAASRNRILAFDSDESLESMQGPVDDIKRTLNIDGIEIQALNDLRRMHLDNQLKKAQFLLYQAVIDDIPKEKLTERVKQRAKRIMAIPSYYNKGHPQIPAHPQCGTALDTDEFPYDPEGIRTAIVWGLFPSEGGVRGFEKSANPHFGIGRWQTNGVNADTVLEASNEKQEEYIALLKAHAAEVDFNSKKKFFNAYISIYHGQDPDSLQIRVLKALYSPEDMCKILTERLIDFEKDIVHMGHELDQIHYDIKPGMEWTKEYIDEIGRKLKTYEEKIELEEYFLRLYGFSWPDVGSSADFVEHLGAIKTLISESQMRIKSILETKTEARP